MNAQHQSEPRELVVRLFPLPGTVFFPHCLRPLHIFEPRYRQMTEHALDGDRTITLVLPADSSQPDPVPLCPVGCHGLILNEERLPDGRFKFVFKGEARVRFLEELDVETLYRQARVEVLEDSLLPTRQTVRELQRQEILAGLRRLMPWDDPLARQFFDFLADQCPQAAFSDIVADTAPLSVGLKQLLLNTINVDERLHLLCTALREVSQDRPEPELFPFPPSPSKN